VKHRRRDDELDEALDVLGDDRPLFAHHTPEPRPTEPEMILPDLPPPHGRKAHRRKRRLGDLTIQLGDTLRGGQR